MVEVLQLRRGDERLWISAVGSILAESDRTDSAASATAVASALDDPRCLLFVALTRETPIGLLSAYTFLDVVRGGRLACLYDIQVLESRRRTGVGTALVKHRLRRYLAVCEPTAIRRAEAIVTAKRDGGSLDQRYLAKVIQNQQGELELERAAEELLALCHLENQIWTTGEEQDYQRLVDDGLSHDELLLAVAEHAAHAGLPVQTAYWTGKLMDLFRPAIDSARTIKQHLIRLYEAAPQRRLQLIDRITALQCGLA